ncbi:hypothetical protein PoB_001440500 [Plakobranchus ocellatus]|uniref:Secreted protein n=1 Tax=Plakobranchus ocellatus TaxID=259542 RepID=A0AAV3YYC2_9GAST|nr:hypothetical protein PoB_001440500 [Plakobranchus ocellatus]
MVIWQSATSLVLQLLRAEFCLAQVEQAVLSVVVVVVVNVIHVVVVNHIRKCSLSRCTASPVSQLVLLHELVESGVKL